MPTPPKPYLVLKNEKKSHRTKSELKQREQGEESLISGVTLKEHSEVKRNKIAHKEFQRLITLLGNIRKNDAIYEGVINRYCMIYAECFELEERRADYQNLLVEIRKTFKCFSDEIEATERALLLIELSKELAKITKQINVIDGMIQSKRKMLFDIERENILTIASALRSIPKKSEKAENPLLLALKDG